MPKASKYEKMSDEQLINYVRGGIHIPGYYYTYDQTTAAKVLRKRGYRVSTLYGTVVKKGTILKKRSPMSFPFQKPEDKIVDMIQDGYSFNDALKHTKKAFKKLNYTITKDEEKRLRKKFGGK